MEETFSKTLETSTCIGEVKLVGLWGDLLEIILFIIQIKHYANKPILELKKFSLRNKINSNILTLDLIMNHVSSMNYVQTTFLSVYYLRLSYLQ